jgi:integrase
VPEQITCCCCEHRDLSSPEDLPSLHHAPPVSYLEPANLSAAARQATAAFRIEEQSPNTRRTYETALLYWGAWFAVRYGRPLSAPVAASVVKQFILDHLQHHPLREPNELSPFTPSSHSSQHQLPLAVEQALIAGGYKSKPGPWALATVKTRLAALSRAHDLYIANHPAKLPPETNPLRDPALRQMMSTVRRVYASRPLDSIRARPVAATQAVIQALLTTCGDDLPGIRDRALLLFGFASGGRRRSEIVAATLENVRRDGNGFVYQMHPSRNNEPGARAPENFKPIQGEAAAALESWLQELFRAKVTEGKIFRRILNGQIREPLKDAAVRDIIRRRGRMLDQPLGNLTAHSLRSGFVTESERQNIAIGEAMALTGHRSVQTFIGYYRGGGRLEQTRADVDQQRQHDSVE